jgi:hypothetical protein
MPLVEYISFGGDCAIAYHLSRLGLRTQAYPFDWITTPRIVPCLVDRFHHFTEGWTRKKHVSAPALQDDWHDREETMVRMTNTYGFTFLHDVGIHTELDTVKDKYARRIQRFQTVMMDDTIQKHIFRMSTRNESLDTVCDQLGYKNVIVHWLPMVSGSSWKKEEFKWEQWFTLD